MEPSDAERQLVQLLRGQDIAEFSLRISLKERHSAVAAAEGRGWHFLDNPLWTIAMSVPQVMGDRTTTSSVSFADAWQRQGLWWRTLPSAAGSASLPSGREVMSADSNKRAETQFIGMVRGEAGGELILAVAVNAGRWIITLQIPGMAGDGARGEGDSFAYAWYHDRPWWQELPQHSLP